MEIVFFEIGVLIRVLVIKFEGVDEWEKGVGLKG